MKKKTTAKTRGRRGWLKTLIIVLGCAAVLAAAFAVAANLVVVNSGGSFIVPQKAAGHADAIIVPGALVVDGGPSYILQDRLDVAYGLYHAGISDRILVSGDHGTKGYDEVNTMRKYLESRGVPTENIFMDHAGFDTYATMYRARDVFLVKSAVVVTQKYHLYRACFLANELGITVQGVACDRYKPAKQLLFEVREIAARAKDLLQIEVFKPKLKYLGDTIPITGSGVTTHDE